MKALLIGSILYEMNFKVDYIPSSGGQVRTDNYNNYIGGCAFNVALTLKNNSVEFDLFTPVGVGEYAEKINKEINKLGLKSIINVSDGDNGFCITLVEPNGERTFVTKSGIENTIKQSWFNTIISEEYSYIYFDGYKLLSDDSKYLIDFLEANNKKQIFFNATPIFNKITKNYLERFKLIKPIIHMNRKEAIDYCNTDDLEKCIELIKEINNNDIIITLGKNGCLFYNYKESKINYYKSYENNNFTDTTGAGDTHLGTVMALSMKNSSLDNLFNMANKACLEYLKNK
ncbi:hypothetical protein SCORR_v1c07010 [Spiroplasma corruscae]|uniref:Carbohydrate kinase PfkB domain-containing protein n=1 Tax=Spiroplasma corruscae TaxID=216934 RepID=A0A222EQF4_9MOLU|nr:PfkB family carbohydrate kinase [Spiroplasma corruscae]ASP28473.1 hypothetical protein SCORR_v1c07010 [Spiroplasma corruscae]